MPGNEREAALTFKLKDAEAFSSELDRILGKLEKIESFSARVGGAAGGGGGAAPTVVGAPVAGPAIGGGGGAAAATGGGPTFAAADPTIPLVAPSGGSPQQQRVAAAMAIAYAGAYQQGAAAPTFTPGYGFSTAYAGGGYVGGSQVPGVGAGAGTPPPGPPTPQPGGGGGLGVGVAGTAVARGFMAGLPFGPTLLQLATGPVGMAAVAGYMAGSYMLNAWDVSVQRGAAIQAGQLITPEMRERWDMQRNIGWVPLVGPRVMQVQGARLGFEQKLHSLDERTRAIGGGTGLEPFLYETQRRAHWTGAVLERTVPVLGAEERIELASRAIEMMPELALPGRQKALASDIDRLYRRYQYGAKDVAAGLESLFSRPEFDLLRIENAKALLAGGTDTPVGRRMAERMTTAALLSGDVSAAAMAAQGRNAGLSTDEMRLGREQYSRGAYGRTYAEWAGFHESIAAGLEAFGATGTQVAGELRRGQDSAAQAARRMIERARRA